MRISQQEVEQFAGWSGDCNPIHVDPLAARHSAFGGTIVHGALSTIVAVGRWAGLTDGEAVASLDIEFRHEIRPGQDYLIEQQDVSQSETPGNHTIQTTVLAGTQSLMVVRAELAAPSALPAVTVVPWLSGARRSPERTSFETRDAVRWTPSDFRAGHSIFGIHRFAEGVTSVDSMLTACQQRVLGLCSFIVGMRAPGLSSLFTRLKTQFTTIDSSATEFVYRLTFRNYDPYFRILETELEMAEPSGLPIATAQMFSYVRFTAADPHPDRYWQAFPEKLAALEGKVVLVCGASRGLGAELAACLGAGRAHVYITCRNPNPLTDTLKERIHQAGGTAEVLAGDLNDPSWCQSTMEAIRVRHGRLDWLVLNACEPPRAATIATSSLAQSSAYVRHNIGLFQVPLMTFLPAVSEVDGTVVAVSSAFVEETPSGFADYVTVKMAMEGAIRIAAREHSQTKFVVARPPKLQTSWNDTPSGAMGAIPAAAAAAKIVVRSVESTAGEVQIVERFDDSDLPLVAIKRTTELTIPIVATFTLDPFSNAFEHWSDVLEAGIEPELTPYAQVLQQCLNPQSELNRGKQGAAILVRISDWLREHTHHSQSSLPDVAAWLKSTADEYTQAIKVHRGLASGPSLMLICPSSSVDGVSTEQVVQLEQAMIESLRELPGLTVWKAEHYRTIYEVPNDGYFDNLREDIAHIPFKDTYYSFLTGLILRHFFRNLYPAKKVVVLDCDNTLWRGVVGEVGTQGIVFDEEHVRLHQRLVDLSESGVLLCLCSKNEEQDVWSVFDQRADFALKREHIIAAKVNWLPKSENIRQLAETLNLGLDSFVFLDDNPVECSEVRSGCPQVLTIQWPHNSAEAYRLLNHFWELDVRAATKEDRQRTQMYREEFQRQQIKNQAGNFQQFIDSLQLIIDIEPLTDKDLARASQLTLRTNQFNLTTIRRTEAELRKLMEDATCDCRIISVRDRFGDYGLVGLFITRAVKSLEVDTFLLSCRVLGRGVEHRMAAAIGELAMERGMASVTWRYAPTERNTPARMFLAKLAQDQWSDSSVEACEIQLDSAELTQVRYQVDDDASVEAGETEAKTAPDLKQVDDQVRFRRRESQIERIVSQFATYADFDLNGSSPTAESTAGPVAEDMDGLRDHVYETFSKSLRLPVDKIKKMDRLDAIGCDSLRVVEITVALTRRYPWLPKTLLFEHRSVSDILKAIEKLSNAGAISGKTTAKVIPTGGAVSSGNNDIAIVGMAVHCAAGDTLQQFWDLIARGGTAVTKVPNHRPGFVGTLIDDREHFAGLVDDSRNFDAEFFRISPREAEYMDPQLRLLLQNSWRALEDAGLTASVEENVGVYVGVMYGDYGKFANAVAVQSGSVYRCWEGFSLANRLSQVLGVHGPSLSIDTACSSSATALHFACESLRNGDCSIALVGGVNLIVDPNRLVQLGRLGILSPTGRCVPFGAGADGTVLGEGAVSLVLRPLADAQKFGDRIYAVIKGTGVSSGAGSVGFTAPNPTAQSMAVRRALIQAGIDPRTVSYIEAHGTGTELGDPIEVRGLQLAYTDPELFHDHTRLQHRCTIGSIKPNVGHLEAGAGLMGVVKVALQLWNRQLVPSITADQPNPHIDFEVTPFGVQRNLEPWQTPAGQSSGATPRRAGVNSFGVGGSNVHIILEQGTHRKEHGNGAEDADDRPMHLIALSANQSSGVERQVNYWTQFLADRPGSELANIAFTQNTGHRILANRTALLCSGELQSPSQAVANVREIQPSRRVEDGSAEQASTLLAMLFSGQGAQYPRMLERLYRCSPVFKRALDECDSLYTAVANQSLNAMLFSGVSEDRNHPIHQTGFTQPALFAIQYSLYQLWNSWGIRPDYLMGHSIGEVAAFCVAGGCSLNDGIRLVEARGRLMQSLPAGGGMSSIEASVEDVEHLIGDDSSLCVAAVNGPRQTVISGSIADLTRFTRQFSDRGVKATALVVSHAFHSHLMEPMLAPFRAVLESLTLSNPNLPIVSTATGKWVDGDMASPDYWIEQARRRVRFYDAMQVLEQANVTHYIEVGPHPVMLGMGRNCLPDSNVQWLASGRRNRDDWDTILGSLGQLYADGVDVDWVGFDQPYRRLRVQVPGYQFEKRAVWIEQLDNAAPNLTDQVLVGQSSRTAHASDGAKTYQIQWTQHDTAIKELAEAGQNQGSQPTWLILSDSPAALQPVVKRARQMGAKVASAIVSASPGPIVGSDGSSVCRSMEELDSWLASSGSIDRVLWIDGHREIASDDREGLGTIAGRSRWVTRCISTAARTHNCERSIWLVTVRAIQTGNDATGNLSSAPLWGVARVASLEYPEAWGGIIDVQDLHSQAGEALSIAARPGPEDQFAIRDSRILVPRLVPSDRPVIDAKLALAARLQSGSVLITGGLGGIGLGLAEKFAACGTGRLILVGRSKPSVEVQSRLDEFRKSGTDIRVVSTDISHASGVQQCLDACGDLPLVGVLHAAGVDLVAPMEKIADGDIERVFGAKVLGGWRLHQATKDVELAFFVCFSSIASVWGSSGRSVYAAANAFLDGLAHYRKQLGQTAVSINFGPWSGGGMASDTDLAQLARLGNYGLDPKDVWPLLDGLMAEGRVAQATIAKIDWQRFLPVIAARRPRPMLAALAELGVEKAVPSEEEAKRPAWIAELRNANDKQSMLQSLISTEVVRILRLSSANTVATNRNLFEMGMDSLTSAELVAAIDRQTGMKTRAMVMAMPTIRNIAEQLLPRLLPMSEGAGTVTSTGNSWRQSIQAENSESKSVILLDRILTEIRSILGSSAKAQIDGRSKISQLGFDSLGAVEFARRLRDRLELDATPKIFEFETLDQLAEDLASSFGVASEPEAIVGYSPSLETEVFEFCKQAWPHRRSDWIEPRWRWMYVDSAKRLGESPQVWLYRDQGKIVGHHGAQQVAFQIGNKVRKTAWLVETMILPNHREKGLGASLVIQSKEDMPFNLSLGQTDQMRGILERLGWKRVAPLQTYMLPLDPSQLVKGKVPAVVAPLASGWMRLRQGALQLRHGQRRKTMDFRKVERYSVEHDQLWDRVASCYPCATVRDAGYLNWKYVEQPGQDFHRLDVLVEGQLIGSVVLAMHEPNAKYRYRRANIVEMVTSTELSAIESVIEVAVRYSRQAKAAALNMHVICPPIENVLEAFGFVKRAPTRFLLALLDARVNACLLLDPMKWLVTQGDSDIDRPW